MTRICKIAEHGSIIVATMDDGTERYTPKGQFDWRPFDPPAPDETVRNLTKTVKNLTASAPKWTAEQRERQKKIYPRR